MKRPNLRILFLITYLAFLWSCSPTPKSTAQGITVDSLYIRALPPGKTVTAGFGEFTNNHTKACTLIGATSPLSSSIEIHQHTHENGMMRMRQIESLEIRSQQSVTLKPGGYHLMIFGMPETINQMESIEITFEFSGCPAITSHAMVKSLFEE